MRVDALRTSCYLRKNFKRLMKRDLLERHIGKNKSNSSSNGSMVFPWSDGYESLPLRGKLVRKCPRKNEFTFVVYQVQLLFVFLLCPNDTNHNHLLKAHKQRQKYITPDVV